MEPTGKEAIGIFTSRFDDIIIKFSYFFILFIILSFAARVMPVKFHGNSNHEELYDYNA